MPNIEHAPRGRLWAACYASRSQRGVESPGSYCVLASSGDATDGRIYVIYDHRRFTLNRAGQQGTGSVVRAVFREEDARAGRPVSNDVRLRCVVSQLQTVSTASEASP